MKKSLLPFIIMSCISLAAIGQDYGFKKKDILVSGQIRVRSVKNATDTELSVNSFSINPTIGYFITNKFVVGLDVGFASIRTKNQYLNQEIRELKENQYKIGAFGRYYFLELGSRFKTYTNLSFAYFRNNVKSQSDEFNNSLKIANAGIGADFFITQRVAIGYSLANLAGIQILSSDMDNDRSTNSFYLNLNSFNRIFNASSFSLTVKI